jgi:mannobiose 2-epimerase
MATREHIDDLSADISSEMESLLRSDLRENWFPRVIDRQGGYVENLDRKWRPTGDSARHLIHQARLAWTAAAYAEHDPALRTEFAAHALHGVDFLDTVFRDRVHGGFYYDVGLDGSPLRNGEKHACAVAFAIFAATKAYSVTRADRALEVAREGFSWLDKHSYRDGTGYVEGLARNGSPMIDRKPNNPLGDRYGDITSNTHIHLLEAFAGLYRADPDPTTRQRLESILVLIHERFVADDGSLLLLLDDRAKKASHGHAVETAYLLVDAAESLGMPDDPRTWEVATRLAERAYADGRDTRHGGFFNEPARDGGAKVSWAQAEALNTWVMMNRHETSGSTRWSEAIEDQWTFIQKHLIDRKHGGWYWQTTRRGWRSGTSAKSGEWQDPYHTARALINASSALHL